MSTKFIKIIDCIANCATNFIITILVLATIGFGGAPILAPYCAIVGLVVMEYWTSRVIQNEVAEEYEYVYWRYLFRKTFNI